MSQNCDISTVMRRDQNMKYMTAGVTPLRLTILLLIVYMVAFADRQLPAMLGEEIAREFKLGDTALGALHGYGFAIFYALAAVPAGCLVDHVPRLRLLGLCLLVWSTATIICGLAPSLTQLSVSRLVVGLGQAALVPAAYSLLGDVWPRSRTGVAVAGFAIGPYLGVGLMLLLGGQLASFTNWCPPFLVAGLFGIGIAFIVLRWPELPRQKNISMREAAPAQHWAATLVYFRNHVVIIAAIDGALLFAAMAVHAVLGWGVIWLTRSHGLLLGEATLALVAVVLVGGGLGTIAGGMAGDRLARFDNGHGRLCLLGAAMLVAAPTAWAAFTSGGSTAALGLLTLLITLVAIALATGPAALQDITPPSMRGIQHGLAVFLVNMFGLGLGPLLVGMVSETFDDREAGLGSALATTVPVMLFLAATMAATGRYARCAPGRPFSTK